MQKNKSSEKCEYGTRWYERKSIKMLGVRISYNKKFQNDLNFCKTISNFCKAMRHEKTMFGRQNNIF